MIHVLTFKSLIFFMNSIVFFQMVNLLHKAKERDIPKKSFFLFKLVGLLHFPFSSPFQFHANVLTYLRLLFHRNDSSIHRSIKLNLLYFIQWLPNEIVFSWMYLIFGWVNLNLVFDLTKKINSFCFFYNCTFIWWAL